MIGLTRFLSPPVFFGLLLLWILGSIICLPCFSRKLLEVNGDFLKLIFNLYCIDAHMCNISFTLQNVCLNLLCLVNSRLSNNIIYVSES